MQTQQSAQTQVPQFEIVTLDPIQRGSLLALFAVRFGKPRKNDKAFVIYQWRLVRQGEQAPWISPPQNVWQDAEGKTRYSHFIDLPKAWHEAIKEAAWRMWQEYEETGVLPSQSIGARPSQTVGGVRQ
jgi:hypothetical protein